MLSQSSPKDENIAKNVERPKMRTGFPPKHYLEQMARHREITLLHIYDPLEASLPPPGRYRLSDGDAEFVMDTADPRYCANYAAKFSAHVERLRSFARRHRISYLSCRTDQDPVSVLRKELGAQQAL